MAMTVTVRECFTIALYSWMVLLPRKPSQPQTMRTPAFKTEELSLLQTSTRTEHSAPSRHGENPQNCCTQKPTQKQFDHLAEKRPDKTALANSTQRGAAFSAITTAVYRGRDVLYNLFKHLSRAPRPLQTEDEELSLKWTHRIIYFPALSLRFFNSSGI